MTSHAWLSLGANIGDPEAQLNTAIERLNALDGISVVTVSPMIVTAPWGKTDQPDFYNLVLEIETELTPDALLSAALSIEAELGRVREEVWGPRLIDIDIVAYDRLVLTSQRLTLPHKHAHEREFVLGPLRSISPATAEWITQIARSRQE